MSAPCFSRTDKSIEKRRHSASRLAGAPGNRRRATAKVSTNGHTSGPRSKRLNSALIKAKSNSALWITTRSPPINAISSSAIAAKLG